MSFGKHRVYPLIKVALILLLFFLALEIRSPRFFGWDDNATYFSGAYQYNFHSVVNERTFPWMVWTQYAGQTNLTQSQSGAFYLPAYLATALSWKLFKTHLWNIDLLVIFHLLIGTWGMLYYLKLWEIPERYLIPAALLYGSSPFFIIVSKSWIFVAYMMCYLPWLLYLLDRILLKPKISLCSAYILLKTLFFSQGYSQIWINYCLLEGLYFIFRWRSQCKERSVLLTKELILFVILQSIHLLILMPQLMINIQSVSDSPFRSFKLTLDQLLLFRVEPIHIFHSQLFIFEKESYLRSSSSILMLGGSIFFLFYLYRSIRHSQPLKKEHQLFLFLFILCLMLSTSLYASLSIIPPFHILRWPIKFFIFVPFFYVCSFVFFGRRNPDSRTFSLILWISAAFQFVALLLPSQQQAFSKLHIDDPRDLTIRWPYESGRVLPIASDSNLLLHTNALTYNFGSFAQIPTLGGYDQLISKFNSQIALGLQITGTLEPERLISALPHLEIWGVRYLTGSPQDPMTSLLDTVPSLERIYTDAEICVWKNREALPLISLESMPHREINFELTPRSILLYPKNEVGNMTIRFAAINRLYYRYIQNEVFSDWIPIQNNHHSAIIIPIDRLSDRIEISYLSSPIEIATFISGGLIIFLLVLSLFEINFLRRMS